jgi:hypothetical protein
MQGIEHIRQFIASAAVTLILDMPFLLIFVGIMLWHSVPLTLMVLAIISGAASRHGEGIGYDHYRRSGSTGNGIDGDGALICRYMDWLTGELACREHVVRLFPPLTKMFAMECPAMQAGRLCHGWVIQGR